MPYISDVPRLQLLVILPSNVPNFWCRTKNHICKFIFWMKGIFTWRSQAPIAKNWNKWTLSTRSWVVCDIIANQFYNYANEPTVCKLTPSVNKFLHWLLFKTDFWFTFLILHTMNYKHSTPFVLYTCIYTHYKLVMTVKWTGLWAKHTTQLLHQECSSNQQKQIINYTLLLIYIWK